MMERRTWTGSRFQVRDHGLEGDAPRIVGYAAVFNSRSLDLGGFTEEVAPGAFTDTIATDDITQVGSVAEGQKVQRVKPGFGADGEYADVTATTPLPVLDTDVTIARSKFDELLTEIRITNVYLQILVDERLDDTDLI